jgi:hypothetical protein
MSDMDDLIPIDEAAARLGVPIEQLLERVRAGDFDGSVYSPDAGGWFLQRDALERAPRA